MTVLVVDEPAIARTLLGWELPAGGDALTLVTLHGSRAQCWWDQLMADLPDPAVHFGAEYALPRPRATERFYLAVDPHAGLVPGGACGDGVIGLVYTLALDPATRAFGVGVYRRFRGRGYGPQLRDAAIALCFSEPAVERIRNEILLANSALAIWQGDRHRRMSIVETRSDRVVVEIAHTDWKESAR